MVSIIVAIAQNGTIGDKNSLLWHIKEDMRFFRTTTSGHAVIMGRKTFDSLPKGALPNRRNVVLSRTLKELPGAEVFPDLQTALASCTDSEDIYVIGGESVYRQAMPFANRLCLTEIDSIPEQADAFFPPVDESEWTVVSREFHDIDEKHDYKYCFVDYVK